MAQKKRKDMLWPEVDDEKKPGRMIARLEHLSDAIIAIIATITALEIPVPEVYNQPEMFKFFIAIFIFLVSFIVIMGFWNEQRQFLNHIERFQERNIAITFFWYAFLALLPVFTVWMMHAKGRTAIVTSVASYGFVYLLIVLIYQIQLRIARKDKDNKALQPYLTVALGRNRITIVGVIINIIIAFVIPIVSVTVFLTIPVIATLIQAFIDESKIRKFFRSTQSK